MYDFFNIFVHFTLFLSLGYAAFTHEQHSRNRDFSTQKFAVGAAVILFVLWAFFVGSASNLKHLFDFFFSIFSDFANGEYQ